MVAAEAADPIETSGDLPATDQRGRLRVDDRVVTKIARHTAERTDGVVVTDTTLSKVLRRSLPSAKATIAGTHARIAVSIAAAWPTPLADLTARVRDQVGERVTDLLGLTVEGVDVTVVSVVHPDEYTRSLQ